MPQVRMIPTGGVNKVTISDFFAAGASAVGMGSCLLSASILDEADWDALQQLAAHFVRLAST